jgi:2'-5' RNA ligase
VEGGVRARLFVALDLPSEVRAVLSSWAAALPAAGEELRLLSARSLHVTLCFLGELALDDVELVAQVCRRVSRRPALALALGEAMWLPPGRPRVVAVGVGEDRASGQSTPGALSALQAELADGLHAASLYEPETRPFLGHVTVARVARHARVDGRARVRPGALAAPEPVSFVADRVILYRSLPVAAGARYEPLETVRLQG